MQILKEEILIPKNIDIKVFHNFIKLNGPCGCVILKNKSYIKLNHDRTLNKLTVTFKKNNLMNKSKVDFEKKFANYTIQLNRSLKTITFQFFLQLKLVGIGYRFISFIDNILKLRVGFSNIIDFKIPKNIKVVIQKATLITLYSNDLLCLKHISTSMKKIRKLDSYKGKGLLYLNENPTLKESNKKKI